jgi:hypothetical protein
VRSIASNSATLGAVQRHQERELAAGQTDRSHQLVEAARHRPRGPLQMQAQAGIAHPDRGLERQRFVI